MPTRAIFTKISSTAGSLGGMERVGEAPVLDANFTDGFGQAGRGSVRVASAHIGPELIGAGDLMCWVQVIDLKSGDLGPVAFGGFIQNTDVDLTNQTVSFQLGGPLSELGRCHVTESALGTAPGVPVAAGQVVSTLLAALPADSAMVDKLFTSAIDTNAGSDIEINTGFRSVATVLSEIETAGNCSVVFSPSLDGPYWTVRVFAADGTPSVHVLDAGSNCDLQSLSRDVSSMASEAYVVADGAATAAVGNVGVPLVRRSVYLSDVSGTLAGNADSVLDARKQPVFRATVRLDQQTFDWSFLRLGDDLQLNVPDFVNEGFEGTYTMRCTGITANVTSSSDLSLIVSLVSTSSF